MAKTVLSTTETGWPGRRFRIRWTWLLGCLLAGLLSLILVVAGLASAGVVSDNLAHENVGSSAVPESVLEGGAIVDATRSPVTSHGLPSTTIALTFDDGPDPTWTPQVLSILRKYHAVATFFVVGSRASTHPELIRAIHEQGSELGHHTFTHPDLVDVSQWRMDRELDQTQRVLAGAAGVTSYLFRPPFSSSASAIDDLGYKTVLEAGANGYVSVFTDADSQDWQRPGVDAIMRNAAPPLGRGSVVLMHDSGGDRSQTVAALDRLIPELQARGYQFKTISDAAGLPPANLPAPPGEALSGKVLLTIVAISLSVFAVLQWTLLGVGLLVIVRLVLLVAIARGHARRRRDFKWGPPVTEPVSIIVPAYNERANIEVALRSITASGHPHEVLVVDDGSTDGTPELVEALNLPGVRVIRQPNGGKASALNVGISHAAYELIVMVDADTMFEPDTVHFLIQPFSDPSIGAVAGNVKVANRDSFLSRLQHIEYVVGFNVDRRVQDVFGAITTVPGAAGAFRRVALLAVGGVSQETLAEDTDLTIALGRAGWRVVFEEKAIVSTEAPTDVSQLWRQRYRWTFGTMQAIWKHRQAILQRGAAGRLGRFGLLHIAAFHVLLPATAPLIDIFFVYGLFFLNPATTLLLWLAVIALQVGGAVLAFRMDGESPGALWLMPAQQLVYRQLMYMVVGQSLLVAVAGTRVRWQRMRRLGTLDVRATAAPKRLPSQAAVTQAGCAESFAPGRARPTDPERRPLQRERWFDLLRAFALVRVVVYHLTGWGWLSFAFPSMGVMFAMAGSLMARSIRKAPAIDVAGHRIRRMLPPLWMLGLIVVPAMLLHGWYSTRWEELMYWVFPVLDPPGNEWGTQATEVLWYLRTYLWFILLTPLLLRAYRRRPVLATVAPLVVVAVDAFLGSPLSRSGSLASAILDFGTYGACWMVGIAHREGLLTRVRPALLTAGALTAACLGGGWAAGHPAPGTGYDLNEIPLGQALFGLAAVILLLRISPPVRWLDRIPLLGGLVTFVNARAMTIYLWNNIAIALAEWLGDRFDLPDGAVPVLILLLLTAAGLAFGWVEDLAARRPVNLLPGYGRFRHG